VCRDKRCGYGYARVRAGRDTMEREGLERREGERGVERLKIKRRFFDGGSRVNCLLRH
jgi:hypothetical protein